MHIGIVDSFSTLKKDPIYDCSTGGSTQGALNPKPYVSPTVSPRVQQLLLGLGAAAAPRPGCLGFRGLGFTNSLSRCLKVHGSFSKMGPRGPLGMYKDYIGILGFCGDDFLKYPYG